MVLYNKVLTIVTGGGTDTIVFPDDFKYVNYIVNGTATLSSNYTINYSGTPEDNTILEIKYVADIDLATNTITILGKTLSQEEANSNLNIIAVWNGSTFDVAVLKDNGNSNYNSTNTVPLTASGANIVLVPGIDPKVLILTGSILSPLTLNAGIDVSGTGINNGDEFYVFYNTIIDLLNANTVTIFGIRLNDTIAKNGGAYVHAVYNGSSWVAKVIRDSDVLIGVDEINTDARTETIVVDCSFDAARQCNNRIWIDTNFTVVKMYWTVIKAFSGTDSGTITPGINGNPMFITPGSFTIPASTPLDTDGSCTPLSANSGTAGQYIDLLAAKTTVGGEIRVSVILLKTI